MGIFDLLPPLNDPGKPKEVKEPKPPPGILLGNSDTESVYQSPDVRINHLYVIGLPRHGKTEMMKNCIVQDMQQGHGLGFIDPHSDAAKQILGLIPKNRIKDLIYFDPADPQSPSFNPMRLPFKPHRIVLDLLSIFKMFYGDSWSTPQEHILRSIILTLLLDNKPHTIADIKRLLSEPDYRNKIQIHPEVQSFWDVEFERLPKTSIQSLTNKLSLILLPGSPQQRVFSQVENDLDFPEIIQENKILLVNLSKGALGSEASRLLGGFIVAGLQQAALARADMPESVREPFYLYVDEFQNFTVNSFNEILSESPKYKMYLTMAHQFMHQLPDDLRYAISGTVGTRVAFQIASEDADKVKHIMNVNRMVWRKGTGDGEPINTFKDYAVEHLENQLGAGKDPALLAGIRAALGKAKTSFSPTQFRDVARSEVRYIDVNKVHHRVALFKDIEIEQEEFPEKYELQNLPKYTAFVRLGDNRHVYRIQTIKCPDPDPMIADYILLKRPQKHAQKFSQEEPKLHKVAESFSTDEPIDEPKNVKIEGNGIPDDNRGLLAGYPGDIREETPLRKGSNRRGRPRRKAD